MAKYPDKDEWIEEILIPDKTTPILGGQPVWEGDRLVDGFSNVSVGQLANRTRHLKNRVEQVELGGVPEAPEEGIGFVRKNKSWVPEKTVASLDPSTGLSETDRLALSQSGYTSGEYWRVLVHTDTEGGSGGRRIVEIQFREQEGVPQTRVDETIRGYNVSDVYPSVNAFDENLTYYTGSSTAGVPFGVGLSRSVPWTVREIAIYYPSTVSLSGRHSPGTFDIQVSSDGENWATVASVESFAHPSSGWYTFSTESSAVERSASLQQLKEFLGGDDGGSAPVVWIEGAGEEVLLTDLSPNAMYILDVRSGNWVNVCIPENHTSIPVGAEYHFVCAGNPQNAYIYEYSTTED